MKLKKKVIKFRKVAKWRLAYQFDTVYSTIQGSSILNLSMELAKKYKGFVCSFRDKGHLDTLKCKLVIKMPEENYSDFIKDFLKAFNGYIEKVSW
jgi:hypothetical protein